MKPEQKNQADLNKNIWMTTGIEALICFPKQRDTLSHVSDTFSMASGSSWPPLALILPRKYSSEITQFAIRIGFHGQESCQK